MWAIKSEYFQSVSETSDLFVDGLNQILVLKYIFFIPLHGDDFFLRSHSGRTILLQYMFQITVIIITFSYKQKQIHICELIYTIRLLFYE